MKRRKATTEMIERTTRSRGSKELMYAEMAKGCIQALIAREDYILLTFPYFVKFDKTYPRGPIVEEDEFTNTYKMKPDKVLDWLHERGFSKYSSKEIIEATKQFNTKLGKMERELDNMFEGEE